MYARGVLTSRIDASARTIGGIDDDTVMPPKTATQIQLRRRVIWPNTSLSTTPEGCSAAANSCTNDLPVSKPISVTSKIAAMLSGSTHRCTTERLASNVTAVSIKNVALEPISSARPGVRVSRPITNPATAIATATKAAIRNGTLPTSTQ
jgi:hypothetical protein